MVLQSQMTHRRLSIVLLDLIGSTRFVERVGPMRAAHWLQYHDRLTRNLINRFSGREIDRSDGFLISFETPINAVNFALVYQRDIPIKTRLQARVGVHVGDVVEVIQHELDILGGAKPIELEGVAKNITARVMSLCEGGQVLLTQAAFRAIHQKTNLETPRGVRYAQVGLYRFKGISRPMVVYAVGLTHSSLQPPPSTSKAKRLGGPRKIKSHLKHMKILELASWFLYRFAFLNLLYILYVFLAWASRPEAQRCWGFDHAPWSVLVIFRRFFEVVLGL